MSEEPDNWTGAADPFFLPLEGHLVPRPHAASLWGRQLNGRSLSGLVAWAAERDHASDEHTVARISVDMFRAVPLEPLTVTTTVARDGHRIRVIDVTVTDLASGEARARGSVVMLRRTVDTAPSPIPTWDAPPPEELPAPQTRRPPWETRPLAPGPHFGRAAWVREYFDLVEGTETSPLVRAAMAADLSNAVANAAEDHIGYINADLQIHMSRLPVDEWVGVEATGRSVHGGVAWGSCDLHDRLGRIGHVSFSSVADGRLLASELGR